MNQNFTMKTHVCGCCKRELPTEAFYMNKRTHKADGYCKECRKVNSRIRREQDKNSHIVNNLRKYPIITEIRDRQSRMTLILHAQQVVNESIARKRRRIHESELNNFEEP